LREQIERAKRIQTGEKSMKIGVINAGNIGGRLAKAWVQAGHEVMVSKDGERAKLQSLLAQLDDKALVGELEEAAQFSDVLLFSVYWLRYEQVLNRLGSLEGKILIDTMNPLKVNEAFEHSHDLDFMQSSSTSEELQRRVPSAKVVKAFSTIPAHLLDKEAWKNSQMLPAVFFASDDTEAKQVVAQLIQDAGFPSINAGSLLNARLLESMGVLLHRIAEAQNDSALNLAPTFVSPAS
jgi:hypothetical protein